MITQQIVFI